MGELSQGGFLTKCDHTGHRHVVMGGREKTRGKREGRINTNGQERHREDNESLKMTCNICLI